MLLVEHVSGRRFKNAPATRASASSTSRRGRGPDGFGGGGIGGGGLMAAAANRMRTRQQYRTMSRMQGRRSLVAGEMGVRGYRAG
jgi:hypothetical protein